MAFGKIPRFSPSFSKQEAIISAKELLFFSNNVQKNDEKVRKFEHRFAGYIGARYAVMVPSARYGFYLLLKALGVGEGDEVVIPALTYFAIPAMVPLTKAKVVLADIVLNSHVIDPESFASVITEKTKVVVPTHLFGTPCDMSPILEIANKHNIAVIEDCAQSTGAKYGGRRVGSFGKAAYYTFGLTKNITSLSGAMITTDDKDIAQYVREQVQQGGYAPLQKSLKEACTGLAMMVATHPKIYWATVHPAVQLGNILGKDPIHDTFGEPECRYEKLSSSYTEFSKARSIQAAVGMKQLDRIEELNAARVVNGIYLDTNLQSVSNLSAPEYPKDAEPIYMSFVVHHKDRKKLAQALLRRGVDTTTGYMNDMSTHELFPEFRSNCPNATKANKELLHIPVHPNLTECDRKHIVQSVIESCVEIG